MDEQKYNLEQSIAELDKLFDLSAEVTDKTACEALAEKARIIYEQYPKSEKIALFYAGILVNLSVEQVNVEERGNTANSVKQIFEQFNQSGDIALQYAMALVNLSAKQEVVEELLNTANSIKQIFKLFQHSENIALLYAMALVNLSAKQEIVEELLNTANSIKQIFELFQHSEAITLQYAITLVSLSAKQVNVEELLNTANSVKQIFELFQHSEDIALQYTMALVNLSTKQVNVEELLNTANSVKQIFELFQHSEDIALQYTMVLVNLSTKQVNVEELLNTANSVKQIFEQFKHSEDIALRYANVLFNLSVEQVNIKELDDTTNSIKQIFEQFKHSEDIALQYAKTLVNLSAEQTKSKEIAKTTQQIQNIYKRFNESKDIALYYCMVLVNLSTKQINVEERGNTTNSIKQIFEQFKHSEDIALRYAMVLFNLAKLQNERDEVGNTVKQILAILTNLSSVKIFEIVVKIFENNPDTPLDTNDIPFTSLTKILDKLCFYSNDDFDRKLLIRALNLDLVINTKYDILKDWIKHYKDDENKLNQLIDIYRIVQKIKYQLGLKAKDKNSNLKFGHYTKGKILQDLLDQDTGNTDDTKFSVSGKTRLYNANYMNDPEEGIVIEQILGLDRRDVLEPSSWFLMSFTNKTDDLAMWSQYGDDAKGVCLVLREDDFSRFTSFNDVSWRQEKNFLEFSDKMYLLKSELNSGFEKSISRSESENSVDTVNDEGTEPNSVEKASDSKGNRDYLYRIAYVKHIEENLKLEQTELFEKSELDDLEKLLIRLKDELKADLSKLDPFYKKAVYNCIEEIRYLFKSVDYKYENELRILRYANLDPSNDKIKIDKESGIGKLYVERENPIQIEKVIFGPKFPNPEYVTPLLKLLDNDIKYEKSTIKFR